MNCAFCHVELSGWKRIVGSESRFCSKEHADIWRSELNQIAVARLLTFRSHLRDMYGLTPIQLRKAS